MLGQFSSLANHFIDIGPAFSAQRSLSFNIDTLLVVQVEHHAVTIVVGETGSGKTTKIPQYLHSAGWCADGYQVCQIPQSTLDTATSHILCAAILRWHTFCELSISLIFISLAAWVHGMSFRQRCCTNMCQLYACSPNGVPAPHEGRPPSTESCCLSAVPGLQPDDICSQRGFLCRWCAPSLVAQLQH